RDDRRTRSGRNQRLHAAWMAQLPDLTDTYLQWKHCGTGTHDNDDGIQANQHMFHVGAISLTSHVPCRAIPQEDDELANVSLLRCGLLGCSPVQPTVAIHLDCLEIYHQIRRRQSSFSIQAMTKVLCALHNVTYAQHLRDQFTIAFDIYLAILRRIRTSLDTCLGREHHDWLLNGACPACSFVQPNEPDLVPARLHNMDGNSSAKHVDGSGSADSRVFNSPYFIPTAEVDQFKDDVRLRPGVTHQKCLVART
ncbi:hypothetical protein BJ138DRAFT_1021356, partial [Hygrophoropsis aurantiaca]